MVLGQVGQAAGEHDVEDDAEGVDVGLGACGGGVGELLRGGEVQVSE